MLDNDVKDMNEATLARAVKLIHRMTGITIQPNRTVMLHGRLRPRLRELKLGSFEAYLEFVEGHPEERQLFIDLVTTNETYHYRTPRIWEYLEKEFLPKWILKHPTIVFNAWSAAASSGEEAHTLGTVLQAFREKHPSFQYKINASDISEDVIKFAKRGVYTGRSIESFRKLRPDLFNKYMTEKTSGEFSVIPEIRTKIQFGLHNLFEKTKSPVQYDLVLIRNVLIYFSDADQEKVLRNIAASMKPSSELIIGESESLTRLATPFVFKIPLIYELGQDAEKKAAS